MTNLGLQTHTDECICVIILINYYTIKSILSCEYIILYYIIFYYVQYYNINYTHVIMKVWYNS